MPFQNSNSHATIFSPGMVKSLEDVLKIADVAIQNMRSLHGNSKLDAHELNATVQNLSNTQILFTTLKRISEGHPDNAAVEAFAADMKHKMAIARNKGRNGWDDLSQCNSDIIAYLIAEHLHKDNDGNLIDLANLLMMLQFHGGNTRQILQNIFSIQGVRTEESVCLHLVWNKDQTECFGTTTKSDAVHAATGNGDTWSDLSTLADQFRQNYSYQGQVFPMTMTYVSPIKLVETKA